VNGTIPSTDSLVTIRARREKLIIAITLYSGRLSERATGYFTRIFRLWDALKKLPVQADIKNLYQDGSVKFAIITIELPDSDETSFDITLAKSPEGEKTILPIGSFEKLKVIVIQKLQSHF
jgi:hypothetical protein